MVRSDSSPALHLSGRLHECGGEPGVPGRPQSSLSQVPGPGTARPFPVRGYPSRVTHTGRTGQVDARRRTRSPAAGGQGCHAPPNRGGGLLRGLAPLSGRRPRGSPARSSGTGRAARHGDAEAEAWTPERGASLNPPRTCPQPLGLHQPGLRDCAVAVRSMAKKRGPEGRRRASGGRGNGTAPASPDCGRQHLRQHLRQRPGLPHPTGTRATASPRQQ